jgi:hypothetical protein
MSMAPIPEVVTNVTVDENDESKLFGYASHELSNQFPSDDQFGYVSHNPSDESSSRKELDASKQIV